MPYLSPTDLLADDGSLEVRQPVGCARCSGSGYSGRLPIHEVMTMTDEVAELVLDRAPAKQVTACAVSQGMSTLWEDGFRKIAAGLTSIEELLRVIA